MRPQLLLARDDGFFTNVFSVLGAIDWCKENDGVPAVRFDDGAYLDSMRGPNWWEYFFEPVSDLDPMSLPIESRADLVRYSRAVADRVILHRSRAADLIRRHIRIRPEVTQGVDAFWEERVGRRFAIGLHMRGTDKFVEQPRMNLEAVLGYVELLVRDRPPDSWRLFLATDEAGYVQWAREQFGSNLVHQDAVRSDNGHALHKEVPRDSWERGPFRGQLRPPMIRQPPYRIGLEALRDALLLARCDVFLASQSCLSYFVAACNPRIPMVEAGGSLPPAWLSALPEMKAKEQTIQDILRIAEERARIIESLQHVAEQRSAEIERLAQAARESEGQFQGRGQAPGKPARLIDSVRHRTAAWLRSTRELIRRRAG